jgi:hypothetical protein
MPAMLKNKIARPRRKRIADQLSKCHKDCTVSFLIMRQPPSILVLWASAEVSDISSLNSFHKKVVSDVRTSNKFGFVPVWKDFLCGADTPVRCFWC